MALPRRSARGEEERGVADVFEPWACVFNSKRLEQHAANREDISALARSSRLRPEGSVACDYGRAFAVALPRRSALGEEERCIADVFEPWACVFNSKRLEQHAANREDISALVALEPEGSVACDYGRAFAWLCPEEVRGVKKRDVSLTSSRRGAASSTASASNSTAANREDTSALVALEA